MRIKSDKNTDRYNVGTDTCVDLTHTHTHTHTHTSASGGGVGLTHAGLAGCRERQDEACVSLPLDPLPTARDILGVTPTNDRYFKRRGEHTHGYTHPICLSK